MTAKEEADKYLNTAIQCFRNNDIKKTKEYSTKAIEGYSKAIESGVHDKVIYKNRGIAYIGIEDYAKAIEDFTKVIELGLKDKDIYRNRGFAYASILKDKDIYRNRGFAYASIEDYPKAIEDFTKVIELDENNKDAYDGRGRSYICTKSYLKAIEDFTKVIELDENNKDAYENRGIAYLSLEDYTKAIEDFTNAIELGANNKAVYNNRGIAYSGIGNYAKAIEDFTNAIELGANDKNVYSDRGNSYLRLEDYQKAIEDFTEAIKIDAKDDSIYAGRGFARVCIGLFSEAIEDLTEAIELGANNRGIYYSRGLSYIKTKDYQKAIEDLTKAIRDFKDDSEKSDDRGYISDEKKLTNNALDKIELTDNIYDLVIYILRNNQSKVLPNDETLNLIELVCSCYDLMAEIKIKPSEKGEQFVHYTKASTLQYLLQKDHKAQLRLNNAVYMNDPEEGQVLKKVLSGQNNELDNLFKEKEIKTYTYLACFSSYDKRDELPMWVHYGDGGKGVGLVFNKNFFDEADLYKVQYIDVKNFDINKLDRKVRKKIRIILNLLRKDEVKNNTNKEFKDYVNIILNYVSYLFKDKAYEYENEVRILRYRDYGSEDIKTDGEGRDIPRLYIEYDECITDKNCVEVIAGPKAQYTEIAAYAKYVGIQKVSQSEIKYR